MKKNLSFAGVLCALILSFNQVQAAPFANGKAVLRLSVEMQDGSYIVGQSLDAAWRFHSALLGNFQLTLGNIRSVKMTTDAANVIQTRLTTTNDDELNVQFTTTALQVQTSFGKTALPVNLIRSIIVSPAGNLVLNTTNLLGYWRFDSVFQSNSSVNNYTGELQGNAQIGAAGSGHSGSGDQALVLDGDNSYLTTSLTGQIDNQGTILAWVYLTAQPSSAGQIFQIAEESQALNDFNFQIGTDNSVCFFTDTGSATVYSQGLPLNEWHFLAATFVANSTRNIYLDGQLVASGTCGGHYINTNPFWIGNSLVWGPRCFQGRIDDVAVFNRALSGEEIQSIYAQQK